MRNKKVIEYLRAEYSLEVGKTFEPENHTNIELNIEGTKFYIHPGVDYFSKEILFVSIKFKTDDKPEIILALKKLKKYFDIDGIPEIDLNTQFYTAHIMLLGYNRESREELKLILWDRVSTMLNRYEIDLKVEKTN